MGLDDVGAVGGELRDVLAIGRPAGAHALNPGADAWIVRLQRADVPCEQEPDFISGPRPGRCPPQQLTALLAAAWPAYRRGLVATTIDGEPWGEHSLNQALQRAVEQAELNRWVGRQGLEPWTYGLKARSSTD